MNLCMTDAFTKYVELVVLPDKEAFERIGQMSGATSFIHMHVTLGIGLLTQQIDKYCDLLSNTFSCKETILDLFAKKLPNYNISFDASQKQLNCYYSSMAILWVKIAQQHKLVRCLCHPGITEEHNARSARQ
jgi:hypothetical protein